MAESTNTTRSINADKKLYEDELNRSYDKIKNQNDQIRYEFTNQDTIVLRKSGQYYKVIGNSVLMLKILGAKTKVRINYNLFYSQEILEMSMYSKKIEETKKYLIDISKTILRDDGQFFIIRLKQPISAKRIKKERSDPKFKTELAEDILHKFRHSTPTSKEVGVVFNEVNILISIMSGHVATVLGRIILEEVVSLQQILRSYTRSNVPSEEQRLMIKDKIDDVLGLLLLVPNFAVQAPRLAKIGRSLNNILRLVEKPLIENDNS